MGFDPPQALRKRRDPLSGVSFFGVQCVGFATRMAERLTSVVMPPSYGLSLCRMASQASVAQMVPAMNSDTSVGVAVSNPTDSKDSESFGSFVVVEYETIAIEASRAGIPVFRR